MGEVVRHAARPRADEIADHREIDGEEERDEGEDLAAVGEIDRDPREEAGQALDPQPGRGRPAHTATGRGTPRRHAATASAGRAERFSHGWATILEVMATKSSPPARDRPIGTDERLARTHVRSRLLDQTPVRYQPGALSGDPSRQQRDATRRGQSLPRSQLERADPALCPADDRVARSSGRRGPQCGGPRRRLTPWGARRGFGGCGTPARSPFR